MSLPGLALPSRPALRGSPLRRTNFMEELQFAYVSAVAAAAGCVVRPIKVDEGVDIELTHTSDAHTALTDRVARLELQLKAVSAGCPTPRQRVVSAQMSRDRYNYYAIADPTVHKIVVIHTMPEAVEEWVELGPSDLMVRHGGYWVNLAHEGPSEAENPTASAPLSNRFDDVALCDMMERIGQGGAP